MTIIELIEKLQTYPPETEVEVHKYMDGEVWSEEPELAKEYLDNFHKVYNKPPCDLTVPANKVEEIILPKPLGKIFWIEFNYDSNWL